MFYLQSCVGKFIIIAHIWYRNEDANASNNVCCADANLKTNWVAELSCDLERSLCPGFCERPGFEPHFSKRLFNVIEFLLVLESEIVTDFSCLIKFLNIIILKDLWKYYPLVSKWEKFITQYCHTDFKRIFGVFYNVGIVYVAIIWYNTLLINQCNMCREEMRWYILT